MVSESSQHASGSRKRKAPQHAVHGETILLNEGGSKRGEKGSVIIGHRIGAGVASRSGLLAGISGVHGFAPLPESISLDDVQLWETACVVDTEPSTVELITILKVADVLTDEDAAPWVSAFADRILTTDWKDSAAADEMSSHLLTLPPHLLDRVLSSLMAFSTLDYLYSRFPPELHNALISCAAAEGTLNVPEAADAMFFLHLSKAFIPIHGLVSVELPALRSFTAPAAALLAQAVSAHPSLISVDLGKTCMSPVALRALAEGLRSTCLPHLSTLRVSAESVPGTTSAIAQLLKKVAMVRTAEIGIKLLDTSLEAAPPARQGLRSDVQSASNPAHLPNLEELALCEEDPAGADSHASCGGLLAFITAPKLSYIKMTTNAVYTARRVLLTRLARFGELRRLLIDADALEPPRRETLPVPAAVTLPALEDLTVQGACCILPVEMAHAVAAAASHSLTRLCVRNAGLPQTGCGTRGGEGEQIQAAYKELWEVVGRCAKLKRLAVRVLCGGWDQADPMQQSKAIAGCLEQQKQLTHLTLQSQTVACRCLEPEDLAHRDLELYGSVLGPVLHELSAVQDLHLGQEGQTLIVKGHESLLKGVGKMKALRALGLLVEGPRMRKVAEVAGRLPELARLELLPEMFTHANEAHMSVLKANLPELEIVQRGGEPALDSEEDSTSVDDSVDDEH